MLSKRFSLIFVFVTYLIVFSLTEYAISRVDSSDFQIKCMYWDYLASTLLFFVSFFSNSISIIDFYWKIGPLFQATKIIYVNFLQENHISIKHAISYLLLSIWALRLLHNYIRSWPGLSFLDFRVNYYKKKLNKILFWPAAYIIFFVASGVFLFLAKLPVLTSFLKTDNEITFITFFGWLTAIIGIYIETLADNQLFTFRLLKNKQNKNICDEGLWFYSRHPNYLGEILFWWGCFFVGVENIMDYPWIILGPILISTMFIFGSAPWMDEHLCENRKNYGEYMKINKNLIFPNFFRRIEADKKVY